MKSFNFLKLLFLVATLSLFACQKSRTDRTWIVQNSSSSAIQVNATNNYGVVITANIEVGKSSTLSVDSKEEATTTVTNPGSKFRSISITNANNETFKKDYMIETNWEANVEQTKKHPKKYSHEYKLVVKDTDF
jgi:uncharacterized membrane protein YcgQ (UPF0703/DUF1980 family)